MARIKVKCFKCKEIHDVHNTKPNRDYSNWYLCQTCRKKYPEIGIPYLEWKNLIRKGVSLCKEWKDPVNGFRNFFVWYRQQPQDQRVFLCRHTTIFPYSPKNCYYSKMPNDEIIQTLKKTLSSIIHRCYYGNDRHAQYYKDKGITVCDEWKDPINGFKNFLEWSLKNGYRPYLTIDRIDPNKGYSPDNCRWIDYYDQNKNRTQHKENKTGYNGVRFYKQRNAYYAYVHYDYNVYPIGYFETPEDASIAYDMFIVKNNLDKPLNHKYKDREELEKKFQEVVYRTFMAQRKRRIEKLKKQKNFKLYKLYQGVIPATGKTLAYNISIGYNDISYTIFTKFSIPIRAAIVRDYIILKLGLPLKKLIHLDMDKSKKDTKGFLLNFPQVLFDENAKKQLFRIAEKFIEKGYISKDHIERIKNKIHENN